MSSSARTMHQWWTLPGPDGGVLELREVPIPSPGAGQVLVRVRGAGVNRGELLGRALLRSSTRDATPRTSGIEFAGTVEALGKNADGWSIGDRVMGRGSACHAEYTVAPTDALMTSPAHMSDEEAAAIPNVFVTAHDALVTAARMKVGDAVLIVGGASGVGTAAIQIARHLGAHHVLATTRTMGKAQALLDLGATAVVDTSQRDWATVVNVRHGPFDVVIDQVGGAMFPALLETMSLGGRYVSVGRTAGSTSTIDLDLLSRQRLSLIGVTFRTRSPEETIQCSRRFVEQLLPGFADGTLRPVLDRSFPLADLPAAHDYMTTDGQVGKIVLTG